MKNRRKLNRHILKILPEPIRYRLYRDNVPLCLEPPKELQIKIADCEPELAAAFHLLHDSYVEAGFMNPHPTRMRVLPQNILPQSSTIVAKWQGQVIGTLSLIRDNPLGLPMEKIFDLSSRRSGGRRLAEVSSLAIDRAFRGKVHQALFPLFRFVYLYAKLSFGTHEFAIAVNPSMVDLYRALLLFERLEEKTKSYEFVNGAPAVGLFLNFEGLKQRSEEITCKRPEHFRWFLDESNPQEVGLPQKEFFISSDPILTPQLLEDFFLKRAGIGSQLTVEQVRIMSSQWPGEEFQSVFKRLPELTRQYKDREIRIDVQMPAQFMSGVHAGEVLNVSLRGIQLRSLAAIDPRATLELNIHVARFRSIPIEVKVQWKQFGIYGLEIINPSFEWLHMVNSLKKRFSGEATVELRRSGS